MKIAFLYGGQGSQIPSMGKELYEEYPEIREFYDSIELDFPLKEYSFEGDLELISQTEFTQPIMLAFQIAITKILKNKGILPDIALGLSLGEYNALNAAAVVDAKTTLELVRYRGLEMAKASENMDSLMLAVLSDDLDYIEDICERVSTGDNIAQVSNLNTKGQIVISGNKDTVTEAGELLKREKIRSIPLKTSGAFHTSYMDKASGNLKDYLQGLEFKDGKIPIIHNLHGKYIEDADMKEALYKQVNNRVLFKKSLEELIEGDVDLYIEIGNGSVIKGFMKRLDKKIVVHEVNSKKGIESLIEEVKNYGK